MQEATLEVVPLQYGRVKGAEWFPFSYKKDVLVLGQGGIGSWTSLLLGRIGCNLHLFDMDQYEEHNMTGQVVRSTDIGRNKAEVAKEMVRMFSPDAEVETYGEYNESSMVSDIVICGFDNMKARKIAFEKWLDYVENQATDKSKCFFQDGRLLAEQLQIFNVCGDDSDSIRRYQVEFLFDDSEVEEVACTFKQTSHSAAMIASMMVGFFTNWLTNTYGEMKYRKVPFFHEYYIPINHVS